MPREEQSASISGEGWGSSTEAAEGSSPAASQPSSIAPPILPAPTSTSESGRRATVTISVSAVPQASPSVSNKALSSASRADLPAQSTNWKL
jgi:hypothetical protein